MDSDNPYQSPADDQPDPDTPALGDEGNLLARSRLPMLFAAVFTGIVALLSLVAFVYQSRLQLPSGEWYALSQPLWVVGHLIRGLGFGWLTCQLLKLAYAIRCVVVGKDAARTFFAKSHLALWRTIAVIIFVQVVFTIVNMASLMS